MENLLIYLLLKELREIDVSYVDIEERISYPF